MTRPDEGTFKLWVEGSNASNTPRMRTRTIGICRCVGCGMYKKMVEAKKCGAQEQ